jgi:ribosomal-protein-serine acetyltransferase
MIAPERIELPGGLILRRWRQADAEALNLAIAQSLDHLRPWMPWASLATLDERRVTLARWEDEWEHGGDLTWGLFSGAAVAGAFGLHRRIGPRGLEVGYWVHAARTRRGHATAGAAALTSVALAVPEIEVVEIHHDRANTASEGVPRRLGFALVGEYPKRSARAPAESGIFLVWRMTREGWRPPATAAITEG